jgi:hypothetical protein
LHFAVAPVGSVLLAEAVGTDLVAVADLAAVADAAGAVAGAAAAAAGGAAAAFVAAGAGSAVAAVVAGLDFVAFCTPPWPLHVPLPVDVVVVPSEQVVVAPAAGVAGVFGAAGVAAAGAAAGAAAAAFCTPPWPLHVPLPVDVVVVPSLQAVGAGSAATLGIANANANSGPATRPAIVIFFMNSLPWLVRAERTIVNRFIVNAIALQGLGPMGRILMTSMTKRV